MSNIEVKNFRVITLEKDNVKMSYNSEVGQVQVNVILKLNSGDVIGSKNITLQPADLEPFAQMLLQLHGSIQEPSA